MLSAAAAALVPEGRAKSALRLVCGLISVSALLSIVPVFGEAAEIPSLSDYREEAAAIVSQAEKEAEEQSRAVIEEKAAAYISDKAEKLGASVFRADITAEKEGDIWRLACAEIESDADSDAEKSLRRLISENLGIAEEEQEWIYVDKGGGG